MIARFDAVRSGIRVRFGLICCTGFAMMLIVVRFFESPASPMTTLRIAIAVVGLGFVFFARNRSLVRRATMLIVLEVVGGVIAFTYVDVPLVLSHQTQIERAAVSLYDGVRTHH